MTHVAVFNDLSPQQRRGETCVVCNAPYGEPPLIHHVPVDVAQAGGGRVYACDAPELGLACASAVGYVPPGVQLALGDDAEAVGAR